VPYLILIVLAGALVLLLAWLRARRLRQRENLIRALLDGADALEAQLQECRLRMQSLKEMLVALPEEMSERANTALSADDKVDAALKDLLAHRLWIQQNAGTATSQQLETARVALAQSGATLQAQLDRLAAISDELQRARANAQTITPPSA
jgi:molybdopterin converting factor small subunit